MEKKDGIGVWKGFERNDLKGREIGGWDMMERNELARGGDRGQIGRKWIGWDFNIEIFGGEMMEILMTLLRKLHQFEKVW